MVIVRWINPLVVRLVQLIPVPVGRVILLGCVILLGLDLIATAGTMVRMRRQFALTPEQMEALEQAASLPGRLSEVIRGRIQRRMERTVPQLSRYEEAARAFREHQEAASGVFAYGCGFYKLVWLFGIGAFLGDIIETIYCHATAGVWMSRSSVLYGPFSIVWGLGAVLMTVMLERLRHRDSVAVFLAGTVLGGVYEYVCSVFTEVMFGTVFWDYSAFKFNLGGRINLLYCFFWGIAAVVWIRYGYPLVAKLMANLKKHILPWMTVVLTVFMALNMGLSALALARYDARTSGLAPANQLDVFLDEHFDNARMERVYPNAKKTG